MRRTSVLGSVPTSDWSAVRTPSRSTVTQSQRSCPLAANALAPVLPTSSSATNTTVRQPRQASRASISRRVASTMAATQPLASHAPRPISRPSVSCRLKGSLLQPVPAGTTSRCGIESGGRPLPFLKMAIRLRRPGATSGVAVSQPNSCKMPARKSAPAPPRRQGGFRCGRR